MGLEFGHHLGLPRALPWLPLSPLVPRYGQLLAQQRALGLRHIGEALVARGETVRVLDGVYVPRTPHDRQHLDADELRRLQAQRPEAAALLGQLTEIHEADLTAVRRVLLYQLTELLQSHPQGGQPATAVSLGVDPAEAGALVHAVRARKPLSAEQRSAAEGLQDEWERGRLRRAARMAALLLPGSEQDPFLTVRLAAVTARVRETDQTLDRARGSESEGDPEAAGGYYLRAARLAGDCPVAVRGLVRTHRPATGSPGPLRLELAPDAVKLAWSEEGEPAARTWRVIRLTRVRNGRASLAEVQPHATGGASLDPSPPLGSEVRYAALPLLAGVVDGPPLVSGSLRATPEVTRIRPAPGRSRIEATWEQPGGARGVRVLLTGPDGRAQEIPCAGGRFTAHGLPTGAYRIRISCRYRTADGTDVESSGAEARTTVLPWPSPVRELSATARDGAVRFTWTGGDDAKVELVDWPGGPPPPGTELQESAGPLPVPLAWDRRAGGLVAPPGSLTRVTSLAVLGPCAVVGPGVLIEAPAPVTSLAAARATDGLARVTFDWPGDTGLVTVSAEQDGRHVQHRIARSVFLREGLYIPVGPTAARLTATAEPRRADTVVVQPVRAGAVLPAELTISYRIIPGSRRPLLGRPTTVRVTLVSPGGQLPTDVPEFVLVARGGGGRAPLRPGNPADGTTVLRLTGEELYRTGTVEREIAVGTLPPPYALRGFLLGGGATDVRLEELSPATLVMR
ncbi:hypothetical protein [Streptomyces sp. A 4/2]|uniref:hypothetical protein n=1 Tax=Streptomyces sp. A 4/2 TaxID=2934314 RepID=UPI002023F795|nr:hypothetical protein [Streptomyces sp. A 4/2]